MSLDSKSIAKFPKHLQDKYNKLKEERRFTSFIMDVLRHYEGLPVEEHEIIPATDFNQMLERMNKLERKVESYSAVEKKLMVLEMEIEELNRKLASGVIIVGEYSQGMNGLGEQGTNDEISQAITQDIELQFTDELDDDASNLLGDLMDM